GKRRKAVQPARQLRLEEASYPAREAQGSSPSPRRGEALVARLLPQPRSRPPARHRRIPGAALLQGGRIMLRVDRPLVSRVREIRMHGLEGGLDFYCRREAAKE